MKINKVGLFLSLLILAFVGCAERASERAVMKDSGQLSFDTVEKGLNFSGQGDSGARVELIQSVEQWEQFVAKSGLSPSGELSFENFFLVIAMDKTQPSGGYTFTVQNLSLKDQELAVTVIRERPGPNCMVTMALTRPFHIVQVEKAAVTSARLEIEEKVNPCR